MDRLIEIEALQAALEDIVADTYDTADWGTPIQSIAALAQIDPAVCGITVALPSGRVLSAGAAETPFSIQSISKAFALAAVLGRSGDDIWARCGREAAGTAFDSIILLEREGGRPRNPFINAGALVTTDMLMDGRGPDSALSEVLTLIRAAAEDSSICIDETVASSEAAKGDRNAALAHFLASFGNLNADPHEVLHTYFHQCAIEMTCVQLARAGRLFAAFEDESALIARARVRGINALMLTCGHYDGSGEFAYRVGLPGKSGVGGGILCVAPGRASVAIWSPGLDRNGNSRAGTEIAARLSDVTRWYQL